MHEKHINKEQGTRNNIKVIALLLIITVLSGSLPFDLLPAFAYPNIVRIPSHYYTASFMYHSQWHDNSEFSHGIQIDNHSNHVIRNWIVKFELDNGIVETVSHEARIDSGSGTVIIDQAGGGQQVWPGPSLYLTIGGVAFGQTISPQNIRLYGVMGDATGGGDTVTPAPPSQSTERHQLFITTNDYGNAFTHDTHFYPGEVFEIVALPHIGNFLSSWTYTAGTLVHRDNIGFVFDFTMPDSSVHIHFEFVEGVLLDEPVWSFEIEPRETEIRMRNFVDSDVVRSTRYDNFSFVRGELIAIAYPWVTYSDMEELAHSLGGEIVGFLSVSNTFQLYFSGTDENDLWDLYSLINDHELVELTTFNGVSALEMPSPWILSPFAASFIPEPIAPFTDVSNEENEEYEEDPYAHGIILPTLLERNFFIPTDTRWANEWEDFRRGQVGGLNWGVEVINAPAVWYYKHRYPELFNPVNIGFIDSFFANHEDVSITTFYNNPPSNVSRIHYTHGTQVASVAVANHNNVGIAGVMSNANAYGYALFGSNAPGGLTSVMNHKHALSTLFNRDIRLINVSMGRQVWSGAGNNFVLSNNRGLQDEARTLTTFLNRYLNSGHDFLIVQSGGNSGNAIDSRYGGIFRNITESRLSDRIIIVGNLQGIDSLNQPGSFQESDLVTAFTVNVIQQLGPRIDILAPGTDVDTAISGSSYGTATGASFAAPHVAGVAGILWSINPDLTGVQVRNLILDNLHPDITVTIPGGDTLGVLYAPVAFQIARSLRGDYSPSGVSYSTILGEVRLAENSGQVAQPNLHSQLAIEIYRYPSWQLVDTITVTNHDTDGRNIIEHIMPRDNYVLRFLMNGRFDQFIPLDTRQPYPFLLVYMELGGNITIQIDGQTVSNVPNTNFLFPVPFIESGRALVPMRPVSEFAGFNVRWYPFGQRIVVYRSIGHNIYRQAELAVDQGSFVYIIRNQNSIETSQTRQLSYGVPPRLVNGVTFMPIRDVGEIMGYEVNWNADLHLASLRSPIMARFNQNSRTFIGHIKW